MKSHHPGIARQVSHAVEDASHPSAGLVLGKKAAGYREVFAELCCVDGRVHKDFAVTVHQRGGGVRGKADRFQQDAIKGRVERGQHDAVKLATGTGHFTHQRDRHISHFVGKGWRDN